MKNLILIRTVLLVIITALFSFYGCDLLLDSPSDTDQESSYLIKKGERITICHLNDEGEFVPLVINKNALKAHLKHGDKILDADGDGYTAYDACWGTMDDGDDNDPNINPAAEEICDDGVDNNCNGLIDEDCYCEPVFRQDFEVNSNGWMNGNIKLTNGYAVFSGREFTRFDGYQNEWPGTWTAEIDVYLDTEWNGGEGFDYIVASNGTDGALQREFIFHISKDLSENKLLIAADSRRSAGRVNEGIENSPNYLEIINTGWYTLQHIFYDKNDLLHVDLNLLDENGMLLFTETISDPKDVISKEIGGNRYGHFHFISITGGLNVDETELFRNCDENLGMYAENIY